jgi:hypothetical protein
MCNGRPRPVSTVPLPLPQSDRRIPPFHSPISAPVLYPDFPTVQTGRIKLKRAPPASKAALMATASASATPSPPQYQQPRPEPCALVAGIISKFSTSASIFAAWRAKRRAKNPLENPEAAADCQRLAACLNNSGPVVQAEYDRDFRYFGSRFSVGDGESMCSGEEVESVGR